MKSFLFLCLWAGCIVQLQAQSEPSVRIGHISDIKAQFEATVSEIKKSKYAQVKQNVPGMQPLELNLKVNKKEGAASLFYGEINNEENSNFYLRIEGEEVTGSIILREVKKYYRYSSTADGSVYLIEEDIDKVLCVGYPEKLKDNPSASGSSLEAAVAVVPEGLESLPGAEAVVFLDFDGHTVENTLWNSQFNDGNSIVAEPADLTEAQMVDAWEMMSEDFRPFVLNVTTSEAVFNSAPANRRMRVIFTPTNYFYPDAGGVAYLNSFTWGETSNGETPCWVFNSSGTSAGMSGAHEVGHTFNLYHDGTSSEEYYRGHESWRPIMGTGSDKTMIQWSKGEYLDANNTEDDLTIIASNHGFTYRSDDHGDEDNNATALIIEESGYVSADKNKGIITSRADVDVFSFSTNGELVSLMVEPHSAHPNLDIMLTLKNSSGTVVATADPPGLRASIHEVLPAGSYYLFVDGTRGNLGADSDYASLGAYSISTKDYCIPTYSDGCVNYSTLINNFSFNTLTNNSSGCGNGTANGYTNYAPTGTFTTSVERGQDYTLSMQSGSSYAQYFGVWIDYNSDKDFDDEGELIYASPSKSTGQFSATITIPASAMVGTTRMRVRSNWDPMITGEQSCSAMIWGEAEDYTISIIDNNIAPSVSIISPTEGDNFTAPANIAITANADDADGVIAKIEFFSGDLKLGEVFEAPYEYSWMGVEAGSYSITAVATDDQGLATTSAAVSVTVDEAKASLTASVDLQGRPAKPDERWIVPVRLSVYPAGQTEAIANYESTTDENGSFTIEDVGVDAGDYVITVKNAHTLNSAMAASLIVGDNAIDLGELKEGDANDDNKVTILDFSILSGSFNLAAGTEGYDDRADFNEDEQVTILDFSLLSSNFNQNGYTVTDSSFIELNNRNARLAGMRTMLSPSPVYLELEKPGQAYQKGDEFTIPVLLQTGQQEIDGAEVHLRFDPQILQVTGITAGEGLPVSLLNVFDNTAGKIDFAAGTFSSLPKGELVLFSVTFRAVGFARETPVTFTSGSPGETVITYKGKSILGGATNGLVAISDIIGNIDTAAEEVKAYPNPTKGKFMLSVNGHLGKEGTVTVIGLNGAVLKQFPVNLSTDANIQMDLREQPTGMYLILLETGGSTTLHRIQKL